MVHCVVGWLCHHSKLSVRNGKRAITVERKLVFLSKLWLSVDTNLSYPPLRRYVMTQKMDIVPLVGIFINSTIVLFYETRHNSDSLPRWAESVAQRCHQLPYSQRRSVFHRNVIVTDVLDQWGPLTSFYIYTRCTTALCSTQAYWMLGDCSKQKAQRSLTVLEENLSAGLVMTKTDATEKDGISLS